MLIHFLCEAPRDPQDERIARSLAGLFRRHLLRRGEIYQVIVVLVAIPLQAHSILLIKRLAYQPKTRLGTRTTKSEVITTRSYARSLLNSGFEPPYSFTFIKVVPHNAEIASDDIQLHASVDFFLFVTGAVSFAVCWTKCSKEGA